MHKGYTIRWRKRWDKGYHEDHLLWVMMDWFIDHAAHENKEVYLKNYGIVKIKRGQVIFGLLSISRYLRTSIKRIRVRLKILEKIEFLAIRRTNRFSIATILNYDKYQDKELRKGKQADKQRASQGQAKGKQGATNNTYNTLSNTLIRHLNKISGRNFKPETNAKYLIPRLREGFTKEQCLSVIEKKWLDPDFDRKYFCPETLFRPSKFEKYLNQDINTTRINKADKIALDNARASFEWMEQTNG